mgnify:CR=1 FL=1
MYGIKKYGFVIGLVLMAMYSKAQTISGKLATRLSLLFVWLKSLALAETWAWFEVFRLERKSLKY